MTGARQGNLECVAQHKLRESGLRKCLSHHLYVVINLENLYRLRSIKPGENLYGFKKKAD